MKGILLAALFIPPVSGEELRITAYDEAQLPREVLLPAISYLSEIFHESGIEIHWILGLPFAEEGSLFIYPTEPPEGRKQESICRARRDIALKINPDAPQGLGAGVLGIALPLATVGLNVKVFDDHIRAAAAARTQEHATILAHAIAHEIGHVLMRSNSHDPHGLMAGIWAQNEYEWMARGLMFFTTDQSRRMRATLAGADCPGKVAEPGALH